MSEYLSVTRRQIDSGWQVAQRHAGPIDLISLKTGESEWYPAMVPGYVHGALVDAGVIQDPNYRLGEKGCAWVDEADWTYRCTLDVTLEELNSRGRGRQFLCFECLDTFATVYVNGQFVGTADNAFIPQRFDVSDALIAGENEIRVEFSSALAKGRALSDAYLGDGTSERGQLHYFNFAPRAFVRKPQYMFGWDWGPALVSCGIGGKVALVTIPVAEFLDWEQNYTFTSVNTVDIAITLTVAVYDDSVPMSTGVALYAMGDNTPDAPVPQVAGVHKIVLPIIRNQEVERWNINGLGKQRRYLMNIRLWTYDSVGMDRIFVDHMGKSVGYREIEVVQEPDEDRAGAGFAFRVNGRDVFIRGANWIPDGCFPGEVTDARLRERLTQARDAGLQMLRVWGGGQYETETFYNLCDELGLLVWQDFPFACSSYPDDDVNFVRNVRHEATVQVRRLRHRACLAMWCGGNENLELSQGKWSGERAPSRFFGERIIGEILPSVLANEDSKRMFLPNSPFGDAGEGNAQNENFGTAHYWNVWHSKEPGSDGDWVNYRKSKCRFSSEFGFAAPAGAVAWRTAMAPADWDVHSEVSKWHDKTRKGYETYLAFITRHFPEPTTFDDFIYFGQANQALALQCGIEHWRSLRGRCMGTLFWQLNDCWPTHSWSVIDSAGTPKLAYYQVKRSCAPRIVSIVKDGNRISAHIVNDLPERIDANMELSIRTFDGQLIVADRKTIQVNGDSALRDAAGVTLPGFIADSPEEVYAEARITTGNQIIAHTTILLAEPKTLRTGQIKLNVSLDASGALAIRTERFAPFVVIKAKDEAVNLKLSDNGFHISPGEVKLVSVAGISADSILDAINVTAFER